MKETIAYLKSKLKENDTLVLGLSGGPDSMCLLDILEKLPIKTNIICAHINHGIRKESKKEQEFILNYCSNKNITCETTTFDKKGKNENYNELELREKRYEFFENIIQKYKAKYLLTAHHGDDLIETILMRLTRGSTLKGYSGFMVETQKDKYSILKPLIYTTKESIEEYNTENNIPSVLDKTNLEDDYTRNRYRHTILPFLKNENKTVHLKYLKFSKELYKYYSYVDKEIQKETDKRLNKNVLNIKDFDKLEDLIQTKIIENILDKNYPDNLYLVNDKHINLILDIIKSPKPNIVINLPDNLKIVKSYDKLKITRHQQKSDDYELKIENTTKLPNGHQIECITECNKSDNNYIRLSTKEVSLPLYVRTRNMGDKMIVKNMKSAKKIKDIFIDCKLPKDKRDTWPIVVDSKGEILWIPGLKKSKFDKAKNENYDIILWYN